MSRTLTVTVFRCSCRLESSGQWTWKSTGIKLIHYNASEPEYYDLENSEQLEYSWLQDVIANPESHDFIKDSLYALKDKVIGLAPL